MFKKIVLVCLLVSVVGFLFAAEAVNVSTWGYNLDLLDKNIAEPFLQEYDIEVVRELGNNSVRFTKLEAQKGNPVIDVAQFADYYSALGKASDLFEPIDVTKLENYNDVFSFAQDPVGGNYAIGYAVYSLGLVYRADKFEEPITSWKDLFKDGIVEHVSLPDITITQGPAFMILTNKIFGGDEEDWDLTVGFEKYEEVKDKIVTFYTRSSELQNLFEMDEVWAAPVPRFAWGSYLNSDLDFAWVDPLEGVPGFMSTLSIIKGAKNVDAAYKYVDFLLSQDVQLAEALDLVDSPTNKNVIVPDDIASKLTYGTSVNSLIFYDLNKIVANRDAWLEEWNERIAY